MGVMDAQMPVVDGQTWVMDAQMRVVDGQMSFMAGFLPGKMNSRPPSP
jgi:hypothetical protein